MAVQATLHHYSAQVSNNNNSPPEKAKTKTRLQYFDDLTKTIIHTIIYYLMKYTSSCKC